MDKALVDTSTLLDVQRAPKHRRDAWAHNTLRNLLAYRAHHPRLTISALTVFEFLDGLHRDGRTAAVEDFHVRLLPALEVFYPDQAVVSLGAEIHAALAKGQMIGVVDSLIAATAISHNLTLITANAKHFARVRAAGFPLGLEDWREP